MDEPDLTVAVTACTEPIVLMVGRFHELADRASISLDGLAAYDVLPSGLRPPADGEKAITKVLEGLRRSQITSPAVTGNVTNARR